MRFEAQMFDATAWVQDHKRGKRVDYPCATLFEAECVAAILNQRVDHPELTRADGKLVSV